MVGVAQFIDLLKLVKWKYFLQIVALILILLTIWSSIRPLFKNDYYPISNLKLSFIFDFKDSGKTGEITGENRMSMLLRTNELVNIKLGDKSRLGVAFDMGDWVYIFFGKHFERYVQYINEDDWNNKDIDTIMKENMLDGIVVNMKMKDFLGIVKVNSVYSKMVGKPMLQINESNFADYFKPLNECEFISEGDKILIKVAGNDPYFVSMFPFKINDNKSIIILIKINVPIATSMQIFYKLEGKDYNENNSNVFELKSGENEIYIPINDTGDIESIRIDPVVVKTDCYIEKIELFNFSNIKNEQEGNYILFYK